MSGFSVTRNPNRGVELGVATINANVLQTATSATDVDGLSLTVSVGARPIEVRFYARGVDNTTAGVSGTSGGWRINIQEGATIVGFAQRVVHGASDGPPTTILTRLTPTAGDHTYKITLNALVSGTARILAGSDSLASISVVER